MGPAVVKYFSFCTLIAISSQKAAFEQDLTVDPKVYEDREDQSEKLLVVHDGCFLQLRKASVLADSVLLRDVTEDGISDRYVDGSHLERYLYEDTSKKASLLLKPQAEGHYHVMSLHLQQLNPKGFVVLTGIEKTYDKKDPYLKLNSEGKVLGLATLNNLWRFLAINDAMRRSDAVYLATSRDIVRESKDGVNSRFLGFAVPKGVCRADQFAEGEDNPGTFSGLPTAVHEIGHMLGCSHDGENDATACPRERGNIMSPHATGDRNYEFSACSKRAISKFLRERSSACLRRKNVQHIPFLTNVTMQSGSVLNGSRYCRAFFPNHRNFTHNEGKVQENCTFQCPIRGKNGELKYAVLFAPDGTPCDDRNRDKKCRYGFCM
ncbi:A disintegrin and metalloproteinase with thrombospondin motifs 19-like [Amblyomma americanum]